MHFSVLVFGPDPEAQMDALRQAGHFDWYGIGGRYTGTLILHPGATSGVVYGDTLPAFEARLVAMMAESGLNPNRGSTPAGRRPGVDQAALADIDLDATSEELFPVALVDRGVWTEAELDPDHEAWLAVRHRLGEQQAGPEPHGRDQADAWSALVDLRFETSDPGELVTVVDCHI